MDSLPEGGLRLTVPDPVRRIDPMARLMIQTEEDDGTPK